MTPKQIWSSVCDLWQWFHLSLWRASKVTGHFGVANWTVWVAQMITCPSKVSASNVLISMPGALPVREYTYMYIEVASVDAAGFGTGRSRYTALCIAYGPLGHPFVRASKEYWIIRFELIVLITNYKNFRLLEKLQQAWQILLNDITSRHTPCTFDNCLKSAQGLASYVLICSICQWWKAPQFDHWIDTQGKQWLLDVYNYQPCSLMSIIYSLIDSYHDLQITQIAKHYGAGSIKSPIAWQICSRKNISMARNRRFEDLAILGTIQAGAHWPVDSFVQVLELQ